MPLSAVDCPARFSTAIWPRLHSWLTNRVVWPEADYLVNQEQRILYCPIAKVACSSVKRWFLALARDPIAEQASIHSAAKRHSLRGLRPREARRILSDAKYFSFAFIRDPWSRLVSGYLNKFLRVNSCSTRVAEKMGRTAGDAAADKELVDISFAKFVRWLAKCNPARFDVHWRPQYLYLQGHRFDFVGRLEHLNDDFAELQRRLGTNLELPRVKTTSYARMSTAPDNLPELSPRQLLELGGLPDYRRFYTDELRDVVMRLYAEDVRLGGYEFE